MHSFSYMLAAPNGAKLEATTNPNLTKGYGVKIREDTVIAAWLDENSVDLVALFGIGTKTLKVTDPVLMVPGNKRSSTITLTSGSIWILL